MALLDLSFIKRAAPRGVAPLRAANDGWHHRDEAIMGTAIRVELWCEDPRARNYNRPVKLSAQSGAGRLWREDHLYDLIVELDHNTRPRVPYRGSAVFIHFARIGFTPTAGCVALKRGHLQKLLPLLARDCWVEIR